MSLGGPPAGLPCLGDRCMARRLIKNSKFKIDPAVKGLKEDRYKGTQCASVCSKDKKSNLCTDCIIKEEKYMLGESYTQPEWHGRIDGPLPPYSHIEGSEWNKALRVKAKPTNTTVKNTNTKKKTKKTAKRNTNANRNAKRNNIPYSEKWSVPI